MKRKDPTWALDTMILNNISALYVAKTFGDICVVETFWRVIVVIIIIICKPINIYFTVTRQLLNLLFLRNLKLFHIYCVSAAAFSIRV